MAFNEEYYLANNSDVAMAVKKGLIGSGWEHYMAIGQSEGRVFTEPSGYGTFNETYYLANNWDVAKAVEQGLIGSGWAHYKAQGLSEGRSAELPANYGTFNEEYYLANNADVGQAVYQGIFGSGWEHYVTNGQAEGRSFSTPLNYGDFDEEYYLANNPDVAKALEQGLIGSGWAHYKAHGISEGRVYTDPYSGGGSNAGQTFTLTSATDNVLGTNGDDTIIGDVGTTVTVQGSDQINGGAGTDTYKIFGAFTAGTSPTGTVTDVETLFIEKFADAAQNFSTLTKAATGIQNIVIGDASPITGETVTTTAGQSLSLATAAGVAMGAGSLTWAGSTTDTTLNLTLNGFQGGTGVTPIGLTVTGAAATTLNIASTGATNKVGAQGTTWFTGPTTVTKHVVSGDKALTYVLAAADAAALNSIDASTSTGGVSANLAAGTAKAAFAFTGGSGNDTVIFASDQFATLTSGAQLNGGAGTGDKIGLYDAALTATEYSKINQATGFEKLGINAALTVDGASLTSINHFSLDTDAAQAFTNLKTGSIVDLPVAHAAAVGIATAVGVNNVTINVGTSTTAGLAIAGTVTVGATVVALTSNGTNVAANTITTLANADNSVITITGSNDLTITNALAATATGSKVDASAFTGKLSVVGNTTAYAAGSGLGDVLIGGSAADTIKASWNSATLTGNGGNDTFNVEAAPAAATTSMVITTITDLTKGDKIDFAATAGAFTAAAVNLAAAATEAAAIDLLVAGSNSDLKWGVYNGNTYIVEDLGVGGTIDATDTIVKLTGVLDLSTSTFSATVLTFA